MRKEIYLKLHQLSESVNRLSSGLRITKAGDDAANAIATELTAYPGVYQLDINICDSVSMVQTAGAMQEMTGIVQRMRELSVQAANEGTMDSTERDYLDRNFNSGVRTQPYRPVLLEFNGSKLIDGTLSTGTNFQVGYKEYRK